MKQAGPCGSLWKAYLGMGVATLCWSSNAIAVKLLVREVPQFAAAGLRIALTALTLALVHGLSGGRFFLRRGEARIFLQLGFWGLALSFFFFTLGLNHTSVSHAVFIGALVPMAVLLLARLEHQEPVTILRLSGLLLSLAGVAVLALDQRGGAGPTWQGDLLAGAGVLTFAYYTVRSKKVAAAYPSLQFNTYCFLAAAFCFLPLLLLELPRLPWGRISWVSWTSLAYSVTIVSAGAYVAYDYSLRKVAASQAAAFQYLQPVLATAFGVLFLRETLTPQFGTGAALILAGVFIAEYRSRDTTATPQPSESTPIFLDQ